MLEMTANESYYETTEREDMLAEREPQSIEQIRYEAIVYKNTLAALLAGATLTGRNGKLYCLADYIWPEYTQEQINLEARVLASYIVG